jgi:hypothetical protein
MFATPLMSAGCRAIACQGWRTSGRDVSRVERLQDVSEVAIAGMAIVGSGGQGGGGLVARQKELMIGNLFGVVVVFLRPIDSLGVFLA